MEAMRQYEGRERNLEYCPNTSDLLPNTKMNFFTILHHIFVYYMTCLYSCAI